MRSVSAKKIQHLSPTVSKPAETRKPATPRPTPASLPIPVPPVVAQTPAPIIVTSPPDPNAGLVAEAVKAFPGQLKEILTNLPAPVIAPRPPGSWVIDIARDNYGAMSKMTAQFHETAKQP